jgi:hypothetical protein
MHAVKSIKKSLKARKEILVDVAQFEVAKNIMNTGKICMQMDRGNLKRACLLGFLAIAVYFLWMEHSALIVQFLLLLLLQVT